MTCKEGAYPPWRIIFADLSADIGNLFIALALVDLLVFKGERAVSSLVLLCVIEQVPAILLSPLAGKGISRFGAKTWLVLVTAAKALLVCAFILASGRSALLSIYLVFLAGSLFFSIGRLSLVPLIVPKTRLVSFNSLNERVAIAGAVAAPWIIGLALSRLPQHATMGIAVLFFAGSALLIRGIRMPAPSGSPGEMMPSEQTRSRDGFLNITVALNWLLGGIHPMKTAFMMLGFVIAGGGVLYIGLPLYFKTGIQGGIAEWGLIMSAFQGGAFFSTLLLPRLEAALRQGRAASVVFGILAAGMVLLPVAISEIQIAVLMFLFGAGFTMLHIFWESVIQQYCSEEMTGRIMSLLAAFKGFCYLGAVLIGALVSVLWDVQSFLIIGALFVAAAAFVPRRSVVPSSLPSSQNPAGL